MKAILYTEMDSRAPVLGLFHRLCVLGRGTSDLERHAGASRFAALGHDAEFVGAYLAHSASSCSGGDRHEWDTLFLAVAQTGATWIVAGSLERLQSVLDATVKG